MTVTGWTWDYIEDNLTLPRVYALMNYWGKHPPLHVMVAAYLGIKDEAEEILGEDADLGNFLGDLAAASPGGLGGLGG